MAKATSAVAEKPNFPAEMQSLFSETQDTGVQTTGFAPSVISPYIWFPNQRSNLWSTALRQHPQLTPDNIALVDGNNIELLNPFRFILMASCYYLVQEDGQGQAVKTWKESPVGGELPKLSEWFEAMVCVFAQGGATLARCRFARTKSSTPKAMSKAIADASEPGWIQNDPARQRAASIPDPRFRIVGEYVSRSRVGRSSGLPYQLLSGVERPITADEILAVAEMTKQEWYRPLLERIKKDYQNGLNDLNRKLVK